MTIARSPTPDQIRAVTFERAPFGHKGIDEEQVRDYLHKLADMLSHRDAELAQLSAENRKLKHALREWHSQVNGHDAVDLVARTQQQVEAQIAQAEQYIREREIEAGRHYDEILAEAEAQVAPAAVPAAVPAELADAVVPADDDLERQRMYASAVLRALDALAAQVDATREAFSHEIGQLVDLTDHSAPRFLELSEFDPST